MNCEAWDREWDRRCRNKAFAWVPDRHGREAHARCKRHANEDCLLILGLPENARLVWALAYQQASNTGSRPS